MTEIIEREVDYFKWCSSCKHLMKKGYEEPCNECLTLFTNADTDKPVLYEARENFTGCNEEKN